MNSTKLTIREIPFENNRLLALCFCSLVLTCTEIKTEKEFLSSLEANITECHEVIKGSDLGDEDHDFIPISYIPVNLARIFWSELLDLNGIISSFDKNNNDLDKQDMHNYEPYRIKKSEKYWKEFVTEEERKEFLKIVRSKKKYHQKAENKKEKEKLVKLNQNNVADSSNDDSKSITNFLKGTFQNICSPSAHDDALLLYNENFEYIRDTLENSKLMRILADDNNEEEEEEKKDSTKVQKNYFPYQRLNKLNYFLDQYTITSLHEFFNMNTVVEFINPKTKVHFVENNIFKHLPDPSDEQRERDAQLQPPQRRMRRRSSGFRASFCGENFALADFAFPNKLEESCVELIKLTRIEGGFALPYSSQERWYLKYNRYPTTFAIWNEIMAEACLKLYNPYYCSFVSLQEAMERLQALKFDSEMERKIYWEHRACNKDGTLAYALQMLPTHLMRAHYIREAIALLQSYDFIFSRSVILGVDVGARMLRQDCIELKRRLQREDFCLSAKTDGSCTKKAILHLFYLFLKHYLRYISIVTGSDKCQQGKIIHFIGCTIEKMGWLENSLDFFHKSLQIKKEASNKCYFSILRSTTSVSTALLACGKSKEAVLYLEEKLALQKKLHFGPKEITQTLKHIAMTHGSLRNYEVALEYYKDVLLKEETLLGPDHMELYDTHNDQGLIYMVMNDYQNALENFEQAHRISKLNLGSNHAVTSHANYNLGRTFSKLRNFDRAIYHLSESLAWRSQNLSMNDDELAKTMHALGTAYFLKDDEKESVESSLFHLEQALEITRKNYDANHEVIGRRLANLASAYKQNRQFENALDAQIEVIQIFKINFSDKNDLIIDVVRELGMIYKELEKYQDCLLCFNEVLQRMNIQHKDCNSASADDELDDDDNVKKSITISFANVYHQIGFCYLKLQYFDSSLKYYHSAYRSYLRYHGKHHEVVSDSQHTLGMLYLYKENEEKAFRFLNLALQNRKLILGTKNEKCGDTLFNLALCHKNCFEYSKAMYFSIEASEIFKQTRAKHSKLAQTKYFTAMVLLDMGEYSFALKYLEDTLLIYDEIRWDNETTKKFVTNISHWISFLEEKIKEKLLVDNKINVKFFPTLDSLNLKNYR